MKPSLLFILATFVFFGLITFLIYKQPITNKNLLVIICIALTAGYAMFTNNMKAGGLSNLALFTLYTFCFVAFAISYSLLISDKLTIDKSSQKFGDMDLSATSFTVNGVSVNNLSGNLIIPSGKSFTFGLKYIGDSQATVNANKNYYCSKPNNQDYRCNPTAFNTLFEYGDVSFGFTKTQDDANYDWGNLIAKVDQTNNRNTITYPIYPNVTRIDDGEFHTMTINLHGTSSDLFVDNHLMATPTGTIPKPQLFDKIIFGKSMPVTLADFTIRGDGFIMPNN